MEGREFIYKWSVIFSMFSTQTLTLLILLGETYLGPTTYCEAYFKIVGSTLIVSHLRIR
jgi:hypothetical protein